jgi:hypothetical protein
MVFLYLIPECGFLGLLFELLLVLSVQSPFKEQLADVGYHGGSVRKVGAVGVFLHSAASFAAIVLALDLLHELCIRVNLNLIQV